MAKKPTTSKPAEKGEELKPKAAGEKGSEGQVRSVSASDKFILELAGSRATNANAIRKSARAFAEKHKLA